MRYSKGNSFRNFLFSGYEEGGCSKAYEHTHALKGVIANIDFKHLLELLTGIMQEMKDNHIEQVKD
ncbi:MAG: hypothetical protein RSH25_14240 [Bacteroides sp.]|uniref:hypothetical protein n=1 Tax=Bacteroides sp. TaxID=29523 RepID=UPI002FCB4464